MARQQKKLGEILVDLGILQAKEIQRALDHAKTKNLKQHCLNADIIVTAIGNRAKFTLTADMISDGAIVIDVGTSRQDGKLVGDMDYENVIKKASYATPVPGGVGPMTIAMLLKNTVTAASISKGFVPSR